MRRHTPRVSNLQAAIAATAVILIACYLVFGGPIPFTSSGFVLKAAFTANTELGIGSPVRIAGVDVGQVTSVRHISGSATAGLVTMHIESQGLPIHSDATAQIRSRIFLEGNFYVDLHPGTPEAPILHSGATLPAANHIRGLAGASGANRIDRKSPATMATHMPAAPMWLAMAKATKAASRKRSHRASRSPWKIRR